MLDLGERLQRRCRDRRRSLPLESLKIHEIYPEMLKGKRFAEGAVLVAHNGAFDMRFLQMKEEDSRVRFTPSVLDTLLVSAVIHPQQELHYLEDIAERFGLPLLGRHTPLGIQTLTQARESSAKTKFNKSRL